MSTSNTKTKKRNSENLMSLIYPEDRVIVVSPALAAKIGFDNAAVMQQLHYWLNRATKKHDGKNWVYKTYEGWSEQDFTFWKADKIKYIFTKLRAQGLVLAKQIADNKHDRTNFYTIDYAKIFALFGFNFNGKKPESNLADFFWRPVSDAPDNFILIDGLKNPSSKINLSPDVKENKQEITPQSTTDINNINKKTPISDNFEPDADHLQMMRELGVDPVKEIEFFVCRKKSTGETSACWKSSFTYWLNKAVSMGRIKKPIKTPPIKPQPAVNDFNDDLPPVFRDQADKPAKGVKKDYKTSVTFNGLWFEPLPSMTVLQTYNFVESNHRVGEMSDETYTRLFKELTDHGSYPKQA